MTNPETPPVGEAAEAVAWRWKHRKEDASRWQYTPAEPRGFDLTVWEVEPLFAHPPKAPIEAGVVEAATELVNFAWSTVVTDCTESADYLNDLVDNLRQALATSHAGGERG